MNYNADKLLRNAKRVLKRTGPFLQNRDLDYTEDENFVIQYIFAKGNAKIPEDVVVFAADIDYILRFSLSQKDDRIFVFEHHLHSFDEDFFYYWEAGYTLVYIHHELHPVIWEYVSDFFDEQEIESQQGLLKYIAYCKRQAISWETMQKQWGYDGIDLMELESRIKETMKEGTEK